MVLAAATNDLVELARQVGAGDEALRHLDYGCLGVEEQWRAYEHFGYHEQEDLPGWVVELKRRVRDGELKYRMLTSDSGDIVLEFGDSSRVWGHKMSRQTLKSFASEHEAFVIGMLQDGYLDDGALVNLNWARLPKVLRKAHASVAMNHLVRPWHEYMEVVCGVALRGNYKPGTQLSMGVLFCRTWTGAPEDEALDDHALLVRYHDNNIFEVWKMRALCSWNMLPHQHRVFVERTASGELVELDRVPVLDICTPGGYAAIVMGDAKLFPQALGRPSPFDPKVAP